MGAPDGEEGVALFQPGLATLDDYGYLAKTGYFVWNREQHRYRIGKKPRPNEVPLSRLNSSRPGVSARSARSTSGPTGPVWPQAPKVTRARRKRGSPQARPLGPVPRPGPERPYNPAYHPFNWRGWWDFGTGALGDMACHTANMAVHGAEARLPDQRRRRVGRSQPRDLSRLGEGHFEFPARGDMPPVREVHLVRRQEAGTNGESARLPPAEC